MMATSKDPEDYSTEKSFSMGVIISTIKKKWPKVANVHTDIFHKWLLSQETHVKETEGCSKRDEADSKLLVILDARPPVEHSISHISGAKRVDPEANDIKATITDLRNTSGPVNVVCYCSIGYRSSLYADAILKQIEKDEDLHSRLSVFNLEGSLFKWANEDRPMINSSNQLTKYAHPYNFMWGKLLSKERRRTDPKDNPSIGDG